MSVITVATVVREKMKGERNVHKMQIIERGFGFTDKVRRKYMIPLNAAMSSSVLLEVVYFEGILYYDLQCNFA